MAVHAVRHDIPPAAPSASEAYEIIPGARDMILVCDHASNRIPPEYGDLGLSAAELERHIAYDIGAEALTRALAARLRATAVLSRFSRLLIDPNRGTDDPTLIMRLSDGVIVPGNARVDEAERARRIARFHAPYHAAVDRVIGAGLGEGVDPVLFSIHSFTPRWKGTERPWDAGVLFAEDDRVARPLLAALGAEAGLVIGENEPYSGALADDTMDRHGTGRGLRHVLFEVRQDLVRDEKGVRAWSDRLAPILADMPAWASAESFSAL
jgi:predicted N-formylglutamate amidohydrolase